MHAASQEFSLNKAFSTFMGGLLLTRALLGFMSGGKLFGIFSTSPDHNLLHLFMGTCLLWAGVWGKRTTARAWNKFAGWTYGVIAFFGITGVAFLLQHLNVNTWADNLFNLFVAATSILVGHYGYRIRQKGLDFMQEMNWPFAKS